MRDVPSSKHKRRLSEERDSSAIDGRVDVHMEQDLSCKLL